MRIIKVNSEPVVEEIVVNKTKLSPRDVVHCKVGCHMEDRHENLLDAYENDKKILIDGGRQGFEEVDIARIEFHGNYFLLFTNEDFRSTTSYIYDLTKADFTSVNGCPFIDVRFLDYD